MKKHVKFIYTVIISISLISTNLIYTDQVSQDEMDLAKLTEELMNDMTPEMRNEVDKELAKFMSLNEQEQGEYLENKFKELSVDLDKAESLQKQQPEIEVQQELVKPQEVKEKPLIKAELSKIEKVNTALKKIVTHIEPLILKTKVLPQVSKNSKTEADWVWLSDNLIELNSFAKIILSKENLIDMLATDEFLLLRDQLVNISNYLEENEQQIIVPDSAGLTINYDDQDETDLQNIESAQQKLTIIIPKLKSLVENDQILWGLKRLLQKYAPQELKKVETEKKAEKKFVADFKPGKETPSNYAPKFNEPFFPHYSGGGDVYKPFASTTSERPALSASTDKSKGSKGGGQAGSQSEKPNKLNNAKNKDDKPESDKNDKTKKDDKYKIKPSLSPDMKSFTELQTTLENISKVAKDNKITSLILEQDEQTENDEQKDEQTLKEEKEKKEIELKEKKEKIEKNLKEILNNSRDLIAPLNQINSNYDKAAKLVAKLNSSIKTIKPDETKKIFQMQIKSLFENPELKLQKIDEAYNLIKTELDQKIKRGALLVNDNHNEFKQQLILTLTKHSQLKDLIANKSKRSLAKDLNQGFKIS